MLPTSVTKATSVLLPEVLAAEAASEVASVVVLVAVLAEEPPQAARERHAGSHYKSKKLFHGFDLLRLFFSCAAGRVPRRSIFSIPHLRRQFNEKR